MYVIFPWDYGFIQSSGRITIMAFQHCLLSSALDFPHLLYAIQILPRIFRGEKKRSHGLICGADFYTSSVSMRNFVKRYV